MKTKEILQNIEENGGFCNINHWSRKEVAEYIYSNLIAVDMWQKM